MRRLFGITITAAIVAFAASPEKALAHESSPACTSSKVLAKIVKRFNQTDNIYWRRGNRLSEIRAVRVHAGRGFTGSLIDRRYCHATAVFQDGTTRNAHFMIEDGAGFAGFGWNVETCIHGLDPWRYYDGNCRVLHR